MSKLREAFDTARNAVIEGTELAKQDEELRFSICLLLELGSEVACLQRDLEYIRSRNNRELDEQVTEVRWQRDNAISEGLAHKDRADSAEAVCITAMQWRMDRVADLTLTLESMPCNWHLKAGSMNSDDAMLTMALEYAEQVERSA